MNLYECILVRDGVQKENLFREGGSARQVLYELRSFCFGEGEWKIYLDDELEISGSA